MTMDKSLKVRLGLARARSVLNRARESNASKRPTAGRKAIAPSAWRKCGFSSWP